MYPQKGFTLIEILIALAILVLITSLFIGSFSSFREKNALQTSVEQIVTTINQARHDTLASKNDNQYGVHFESDAITLFEGSTYSSSDPTNEDIELNGAVELANISFSGGTGQDVIFERLTGATNNAGSVVLRVTNTPTRQKNITVEATGVINVQ